MNLLIFDDDQNNVLIMKTILKSLDNLEIYTASTYSEFKEIINNKRINLFLLDLMMPEKNGLEIIEEIKDDKNHYQAPIIMITAIENYKMKEKAYELGASDYIVKPIHAKELLLRVKNQLDIMKMKEELLKHNKYLHELVDIRVKEVINTRNVTIFSLAKLAESRDPDTGEHLKRIMNYCKFIATELSKNPKYENIDDEFIDNLYISSVLHDIGKVGIPDNILLKPGKLTPEEFEIMKQHTIIGGRTLEEAENQLQFSDFLSMGKVIAYYHHERWNGTGYPKGLKGEEIPLPARIVTLADVFDALMSKRIYKPAFSFEETYNIMKEENGKLFDPDIFEIFEKNKEHFKEIYVQNMEKE